MKNLIGLFFAFSFLLFSCSEKKENEKRDNSDTVYHKTKWEDGSIKAEGYYINDSIKEGLFKRYYRGGKLEFEINYHKNKEDGLWIRYFENGMKQFVVHYKNGIRSGTGEEFYENGVIKEYRVYNLKGDSGFEIDYLEDGSIKDVIGAAVIDYSVNNDTLDRGDTLKINFIVATPKNSKVKFQFYEDAVTKQNSQYLAVNEKEGYGSVTYKKVLLKKGIMNWGGTTLIKFDNGKEKDVKFKFVGFTTVR